MPITKQSQESDHELRWRNWKERGRRADKLAEKRMTVLFSVVCLILVALILYTLWAKESPGRGSLQSASGRTTFQSHQVQVSRGDARVLVMRRKWVQII